MDAMYVQLYGVHYTPRPAASVLARSGAGFSSLALTCVRHKLRGENEEIA
jgi:hypothetical protein